MAESLLVKALFAYLHYISIFGVVVALAVEGVIFKPTLSVKEAKLLQKTDGLYGLSAILVLATGLLRAFIFEKGGDYYFSNYIFITKLSLFVIVGLLSIYPTVYFMKWNKLIKSGATEILVDKDSYPKLKKVIIAEIILMFLIPLMAALMARGYGFTL